MTDSGQSGTALEPLMIHDACTGQLIWLGSEEAVRAAAEYEHGDDPGTLVEDGWMMDVGWDRDTYELKRDFEAETGYQGWWEGCRAPADGVEGKKLRRAWRWSQ